MVADSMKSGRYRWVICLLLFLMTTKNYMDRQMFSIASPVVANEYGLSNSDIALIVNAFLLAYTFGQLFAGRFMDWMGSRWGLTIVVLIWSVAGTLTSLATSVFTFGFYRFVLGTAESGNFPGGVKVVAEWFPSKERSTAVGIFTSGASIGAILTPPIAAYLIVKYGWRLAFVAIGIPGLLWIPAWLSLYGPVSSHPRLSSREQKCIFSDRMESTDAIAARLPRWSLFLKSKAVWGIFLGRFIEEPASWFYLTWLPIYLKEFRDIPLLNIGFYLIIPFVTLDVGYIGGGWAASRLIRNGWSLSKARKAVMLISACCMLSSIPAAAAPTALSFVFLISVATFGHGSWASNVMTMPGDIVPHDWVGTVYGITAFGGGIGSVVFMQLVGRIVDTQHSFKSVFFIAGILPLFAFGVLSLLIGKLEALKVAQAGENGERVE